MKSIYDVIRRPLITEKAAIQKETQHTVCFEVHRDATKPEIKKAVETLFDTKVSDVRVARVHGKVKRQGARATGRERCHSSSTSQLLPGAASSRRPTSRA
jgi:large subunit ribosomal protein L23